MPRWPKRDITPIPIEDGKRILIPLTQGMFAKIDAADLKLIGPNPWGAHIHPNGKPYAQQYGGHINGQRKIRYMHRVIMGEVDPSIKIDHANRNDTLNNTRDNIRLATQSQQLFNTDIRSDCLTDFKGVHHHKPTGTYISYLTYCSIRIHLGYYSVASDAARIRDRAALELHGEFASLNYPRSEYKYMPRLNIKDAFQNAVAAGVKGSFTFRVDSICV